MINHKLFILTFLLVCVFSFPKAQTNCQQVIPPEIQDFSPILQFLASPELEGRDPGQRGSMIAANYIASMMQNLGLKPYHEVDGNLNTILSDYFQTFTLPVFTVKSVSISVEGPGRNAKKSVLIPGIDFKVENAIHDLQLQSDVVFAGYGINSPAHGYNDYAGLDVSGRMVLLLDGYPGQHDTASVAWGKFKTVAENDAYDLDKKCREAARLGASAIIVIDKEYLQSANGKSGAKISKTPEVPILQEPEFFSANQLSIPTVTRILLNEKGSKVLADKLKTDFRNIEKLVAQQLVSARCVIKDHVNINMQISSDTLLVHNVISYLPGKDSTRTIILGAHYDHLGKRGNDIFYGSDDNASGVAGLLALAKMWTESRVIPACNIMFASWTAEEKGLIGSEYFASQLKKTEKVKLYMNMDMISRSVKEDTAGRQLSIGTRTEDEFIREIARSSNSTLDHPFELDLWDVTGHSGSDYASFTAKNIPIMTYNTGLHDDYHNPRDIPASADFRKMGEVLKLINNSLQEVLENISGE